MCAFHSLVAVGSCAVGSIVDVEIPVSWFYCGIYCVGKSCLPVLSGQARFACGLNKEPVFAPWIPLSNTLAANYCVVSWNSTYHCGLVDFDGPRLLRRHRAQTIYSLMKIFDLAPPTRGGVAFSPSLMPIDISFSLSLLCCCTACVWIGCERIVAPLLGTRQTTRKLHARKQPEKCMQFSCYFLCFLR